MQVRYQGRVWDRQGWGSAWACPGGPFAIVMRRYLPPFGVCLLGTDTLGRSIAAGRVSAALMSLTSEGRFPPRPYQRTEARPFETVRSALDLDSGPMPTRGNLCRVDGRIKSGHDGEIGNSSGPSVLMSAVSAAVKGFPKGACPLAVPRQSLGLRYPQDNSRRTIAAPSASAFSLPKARSRGRYFMPQSGAGTSRSGGR